jgi:cephalosporin hydroxylase
VRDHVNLVPGYSPQAVQALAAQRQQPWSLIFIDGNHERPGPLEDAMVCAQLAAPDAAIVFHNLASPDVAEGLDYLRQQGWNTMVYQTMQIMGVAWRGNVEPIQHQPDPQVNWTLPPHLQGYLISGMVNFPSQVTSSAPGIVDPQAAIPQIQALMQQSVNFYNNNQPVEALRAVEQAASLRIFIPGLYYLRAVCLVKVGRCEEALAAAREELRLNPVHTQVRAFIDNLAQAITRPEASVIPTSQRPWNTSLNRETLMSIQNASHNYAYRGVPMIKNPFDFALYPMLLWNVKPRTIIEIGSKEGGSGLWLGDLIDNFDLDCHIYSLDIVRVDSVSHPRVTFMEANGRLLGETLSAEFINSLPRPLLIIEDADHAYETSIGVLEFFHPHLQLGEYIVIEDGIISDIAQDPSYNSGPHRALKEFLGRYPDHYEIDGNYCDFFGYNLTWCTNGFLKKVR